MIGNIILLGLTSLTLAGEPDVFGNYFDDSIKEVDISLDVAIKACLQNGNAFSNKVKAAYGECFGTDYNFDNLAAESDSNDSDSDGLPDSFEGNEACFYKEMGWVVGSNVAADVIKADLVGLEASLKTEFDGNIDKCASWTGSFGTRRKRGAGEAETDEEVPSVMEKGNAALGWLSSAVRKTRSADPQDGKGNGKGKGKGKGKKNSRKGKGKGKKNTRKSAKKGKGKGKKNNRKGTKKGKGKGKKNTRKSAKKGKGKGKKNSRKGTKKGKGKGKKNTRKSAKKGKGKGKKNSRKGKGRNDKKGGKKSKGNNGGTGGNNGEENGRNSGMDEATYNKLWCFDLSLEQVLETCVENKIKN